MSDVAIARLAQGALTGLLAAAAVDFHAFKAWQSFSDLKAYNWNVALFRWMQGAVIGALTSVGLGSL